MNFESNRLVLETFKPSNAPDSRQLCSKVGSTRDTVPTRKENERWISLQDFPGDDNGSSLSQCKALSHMILILPWKSLSDRQTKFLQAARLFFPESQHDFPPELLKEKPDILRVVCLCSGLHDR